MASSWELSFFHLGDLRLFEYSLYFLLEISLISPVTQGWSSEVKFTVFEGINLSSWFSRRACRLLAISWAVTACITHSHFSSTIHLPMASIPEFGSGLNVTDFLRLAGFCLYYLLVSCKLSCGLKVFHSYQGHCPVEGGIQAFDKIWTVWSL